MEIRNIKMREIGTKRRISLRGVFVLLMIFAITPKSYAQVPGIWTDWIRLNGNPKPSSLGDFMAQLGDPTATGNFTTDSLAKGFRYNFDYANRYRIFTGMAVPDPANPGTFLEPVMTNNPDAPPSDTAYKVSNVTKYSITHEMAIGNIFLHDNINSAASFPYFGTDGIYDGFTGNITAITGFYIEHTAKIVLNPYTERPDMIEFFFTVKNISGEARVFGLSWNVDTQVGDSGGDDAPFIAPGIRDFTTDVASMGFPIPADSPAEAHYRSKELFEFNINPYSNSVPEYFYAMHPTMDFSALIMTGLDFRDGIFWQPADYAAVAYYRDVASSYYYGVNNGIQQGSEDAGHMLRWNPRVVLPGETIFLAYGYGAGDGKNFMSGKINFVNQGGTSIIYQSADTLCYTNAPFSSVTRISNQSAAKILSGEITLKIPRAHLEVDSSMLEGPDAWYKDESASGADPDYDYYIYIVDSIEQFTPPITIIPPVYLDVLPQYEEEVLTSYFLELEVKFDNPGVEQANPIEKRLWIPKLNPIIIAATAGENGEIDPEGTITVRCTGSQKFNFMAHTGYHIDSVYVDGKYNEEAVKDSYYIFENVTKNNHTIHVTFAKDPYIITATAGDNGEIVPSGVVSVAPGADQTFTFIPDKYYEIEQVLIDGTNDTTAITAGAHTFYNVTENHTIEVFFKFIEIFIPVTEINNVPPSVVVERPLLLVGKVIPENANNQSIIWSVKDTGDTGANFSGEMGNMLNTKAEGIMIATATIIDGAAIGVDYTQDFTIRVKPHYNPQIRVNLFPNPTRGEFFIRNENISIEFESIKIYSIYGKMLSAHTPVPEEEELARINISHLAAGIYIVNIITETGIVVPVKVVKY